MLGLFIYLCSVQSRSLNRSNICIDFCFFVIFWLGRFSAATLWCRREGTLADLKLPLWPGPHHHGRRQQSNFGLTLSARSSAYNKEKK